jgi:hypothetical protein
MRLPPGTGSHATSLVIETCPCWKRSVIGRASCITDVMVRKVQQQFFLTVPHSYLIVPGRLGPWVGIVDTCEYLYYPVTINCTVPE